MKSAKRKLAFVLAASSHGTLIVNRFDYQMTSANSGFGVGFQILEGASFDPEEVAIAVSLLSLRRQYFGDGVVAIDCGANIGVHTIEWAVAMTGWGSVLAIEAQERIFYALAGNIALNNCFNARALHAAVTARDGTLRVPSPDYQRPGSFGSLELRQRPSNEFIGQAIDYSDGALYEIKTVALDSLGLSRVDLIKIDVEGMELEVLAGASAALASCRPVILIEWIKSTKPPLMRFFASLDYMVFEAGINLIAVHKDDRCLGHVQQGGPNRPS